MGLSLLRDDTPGVPEASETAVDVTAALPVKDVPSIMTQYFRDVGRFSLLSHERETMLARQIHEGSQQWRDLLQHHLLYVPSLLACQARLRRGTTFISAICTEDNAPSHTDLVAMLDHLQRVRGRMRQLVKSPSHHQADAAAMQTAAALCADMRTLLRPWSWHPAFLHRAWTGFDRAMAAESSARQCRRVARFTTTLGYSPSELRALWQQLRDLYAQVEGAKQEMITRNLRLVISVAREFRHGHTKLSMTDLIQEGNIGLMRAVEKYDYRRNLKFITYAVWWIKQAMRRVVFNQSTLIRMPEYMHVSIHQVYKAQERLATELGRSPTVQEIAEHLGMPRERVERSNAPVREPISLDHPIADGHTFSLSDTLSDSKAVSSQESLEQQDLAEHIQRVLNELTSREAEVIRRRFGLHGRPAETLRQVGLHLHLSHERVRQIEVEALAKLKQQGAILRDFVQE